jgi:hypothetical protein
MKKYLIEKLKALRQLFVSKRSEQLVCDACNNHKPTIKGLEDCKCGNGNMWINQNNCC